MSTNTMTVTNTTAATAVQNPDYSTSDASQKAFKEDEYQELVDFCKWDASKTKWLDEGIRDIRFEASYDEPLCAPEYAKQLKVSEEAILDTQQHAGLNLTTSIGKKPVGDSATRNICARAMIGMNCYELLRKNNRGSLKEVLNLILAERKGATRIKFSHEKIRAVHSGRYSAISNEKLLDIMVHRKPRRFSPLPTALRVVPGRSGTPWICPARRICDETQECVHSAGCCRSPVRLEPLI